MTRHALLLLPLVLLLLPQSLVAAPITYAMQFRCEMCSVVLAWEDGLPNVKRPDRMTFTFDAETSLFDGFGITWLSWAPLNSFVDFPMNPLLNTLFEAEERTKIFNALLSPEENVWALGTSAMGGTQRFHFSLDAPGLTPVVHLLPDFGLFSSGPTGFTHLISRSGPECGDPEHGEGGCGFGGTYTVTAVPEPSPLLSMIAVGVGLLIGRAKFV
jgi:hypothetical protein